jgi:hypothetical protein
MDAGGNAIAVWQQSDGTLTSTGAARSDIWANRFDAATGTWGTAQLIETDNAGTASSPQIAMDAGGNGIAVWMGTPPSPQRYNTWANRFSAASGAWGTAQAIETSNQEAIGPQIAFDVNGNAMAIWSRFGGGAPGAIVVNRFD